MGSGRRVGGKVGEEEEDGRMEMWGGVEEEEPGRRGEGKDWYNS